MTDDTVAPLISVIVPCFNHEAYVSAALDSILHQTYPNLEVLIVDDCSTDLSFSVISDWIEQSEVRDRFAEVRLLRNDNNRGARDSLNAGLGMARGEFITILNSDDLYHPDRILSLYQAARASNAELLGSAVTAIDHGGGREASPGLSSDVESMVDFADAHPSVSFALLKKNIFVTTGNLFFSSGLAKRLGGFRDLRYCHDWDFAVRACLVTEPVLLAQALYSYRLHVDNSFKALQEEQFLEPQVVYRGFFAACRAGKCVNPLAPDPSTWGYFGEKYFSTGHYLKDAYKMSGGALPLFDSIAKTVRFNVQLSRASSTRD